MSHKIRIHYIDTPKFIYNGVEYYMQTRMIRNFSDIDSIIERHLKECQKNNTVTEMAILSITNMHGDSPVKAITGEYVPFLRYCFFPSVENELPIPYKLNNN